MRHYLLKRLLLLPPTLFGILLIAFFITRFVPGGPLEQALEEKRAASEKRSARMSGASSGSLSPEEVSRLKEMYGLDRPTVPAFFEWLGAIPKELSPKTTVTFAPGETGAKPLHLEVPVSIKRLDTEDPSRTVSESTGFGFEASVSLDAAGRTQVKLPADLAEKARAWAVASGADSASVERQARRALSGWSSGVVPQEYDKPTGLRFLRSLFLVNDAAPKAGKPVRVKVYRTGFSGVLQGDFGMSFTHSRPVLEVIASKIPVSLRFGIASMILAYAIAIPVGMMKAMRHGSRSDSASSFLLFVFSAVPGFVLGIVLLKFFASMNPWFPMTGLQGDNYAALTPWGQFKDYAWHMVLPLTAMTVGQLAFMSLLMKNSLMDNLGADYVRTAVAKGVPFRKAVLRHAFRNSLVPLATSFGNNIGVIFTGSFLIERTFDIDGFGLLSFNALVLRDYPVFLANLLFGALLLLIGNILSDICVALVDPRIRFDK